jgi:hypothetical protein
MHGDTPSKYRLLVHCHRSGRGARNRDPVDPLPFLVARIVEIAVRQPVSIPDANLFLSAAHKRKEIGEPKGSASVTYEPQVQELLDGMYAAFPDAMRHSGIMSAEYIEFRVTQMEFVPGCVGTPAI